MKLCSFLQPPDTSYTLSSNNILNSTPSNTTNPQCSTPSHFTPHNLFISKQYSHAIFSLISVLCKIYLSFQNIYGAKYLEKIRGSNYGHFITS
jgi:hypothetical protein